MPVAKLCEHTGQHFKRLAFGHGVVDLLRVFRMNGIPVHILLLKETVVLIHNFPQSLKVASWVVGQFVLVNTACEEK